MSNKDLTGSYWRGAKSRDVILARLNARRVSDVQKNTSEDTGNEPEEKNK